RATAARPEPIERPPECLLCFGAAREPTHLRPSRTSSFEPIPVRPQRLTVRALRRQLEYLTLLDHLEPPRSTTGSRNQTALTTSLIARGSTVRVRQRAAHRRHVWRFFVRIDCSLCTQRRAWSPFWRR